MKIRPGCCNGSQLDRRRLRAPVMPRAETETEMGTCLSWHTLEWTQVGGRGMLQVRCRSRPPAGCLLARREAGHLLAQFQSRAGPLVLLYFVVIL